MFIVIQSINTIRNELKSRNQSVSNNNTHDLKIVLPLYIWGIVSDIVLIENQP